MTEPMAEQQATRVPAPPRPGVLRPLPALRPADLSRVPAAGRGRRPVRRLRPRGPAGRADRRAPSSAAAVTTGRPVVTLTIIAICVAVWLAQQVSPAVTQELSFAPYQGQDEPWRFLTAAFAHSQGQPLHILFNMFALWQIGTYLEPMLGPGPLRRALPHQRARRLGRLPAAGHPARQHRRPAAGQLVGHRHGRGLGGGVRPVRRAAGAQPAPGPVLGRHRRRAGHQRRARVRHPRHRLAGPPRRGDHRRACSRRSSPSPRPGRASGCSCPRWLAVTAGPGRARDGEVRPQRPDLHAPHPDRLRSAGPRRRG